MKVGDKVKIVNTNDAFSDKTGLVEWLDEEGDTCTVFVDFLPGKRVRQDFSLDNVEFITSDTKNEIESSEVEEDEDDVSDLEVY